MTGMFQVLVIPEKKSNVSECFHREKINFLPFLINAKWALDERLCVCVRVWRLFVEICCFWGENVALISDRSGSSRDPAPGEIRHTVKYNRARRPGPVGDNEREKEAQLKAPNKNVIIKKPVFPIGGFI